MRGLYLSERFISFTMVLRWKFTPNFNISTGISPTGVSIQPSKCKIYFPVRYLFSSSLSLMMWHSSFSKSLLESKPLLLKYVLVVFQFFIIRSILYVQSLEIIFSSFYSFLVLAQFLSVLQSWTGYLGWNGGIQYNWTGQEKFGIYFCVFFDCYWQSLISGKETKHQTVSKEIFLIFPYFLRS